MPRLLIFAGLLAAILCAATGAFAFQLEFRDYGGEDQGKSRLPPDYKDPAEFLFGRLMYPGGGGYGGFGGFRGNRGGGGDWRTNAPGQGWGNDYPSADRHLLVALRRLTSMNARSVEQPVNLENGDDVFNLPFLFAGRTTSIELTDEMTDKLREYLNRGGFLVCDDMWGEDEHQAVLDLAERLYPKREVVELGNTDEVMHTVYDLNDRYQIIGSWGQRSGFTEPLHSNDPSERIAHWKGVFDDKHRMVLGLWFNSDTGDSWEWADVPEYPEHFSALGFRIVINHIIYDITH